MGLVELMLMGVGLAMDAFAVSICKGLAMRKVNKKQCFVIALFFGGFQDGSWEVSSQIRSARSIIGLHLFCLLILAAR